MQQMVQYARQPLSVCAGATASPPALLRRPPPARTAIAPDPCAAVAVLPAARPAGRPQGARGAPGRAARSDPARHRPEAGRRAGGASAVWCGSVTSCTGLSERRAALCVRPAGLSSYAGAAARGGLSRRSPPGSRPSSTTEGATGSRPRRPPRSRAQAPGSADLRRLGRAPCRRLGSLRPRPGPVACQTCCSAGHLAADCRATTEMTMRLARLVGGVAVLLAGAALAAEGDGLLVSGSNVNVRAGPSTEAGILTRVGTNEPAIERRRQGQWVEVELPDQNVLGWIHDFLLIARRAPGRAAARPPAAPAGPERGPASRPPARPPTAPPARLRPSMAARAMPRSSRLRRLPRGPTAPRSAGSGARSRISTSARSR